MILENGTTVHTLRDLHNSGYAGFGYGGRNLYAACLVDCFDPPVYLVRADTFEDALDVAVECLCDSFETWADDHDMAEMYACDSDEEQERFMDAHTLMHSPSGRLVSADDDVRVWWIAGADRDA